MWKSVENGMSGYKCKDEFSMLSHCIHKRWEDLGLEGKRTGVKGTVVFKGGRFGTETWQALSKLAPLYFISLLISWHH